MNISTLEGRGSSAAGAPLRNLGKFVYTTWPVYFGGVTNTRWFVIMVSMPESNITNTGGNGGLAISVLPLVVAVFELYPDFIDLLAPKKDAFYYHRFLTVFAIKTNEWYPMSIILLYSSFILSVYYECRPTCPDEASKMNWNISPWVLSSCAISH